MCSVRNCHNRFYEGCGLHFYRIPRGKTVFEENRRKLWLKAIGREDEEENWNAARICSDHFISGERSNDPQDPDFVPSIFRNSKAQEERRRRAPNHDRQCSALGCKKRKKRTLEEEFYRSSSDGSEDEETELKRRYPRTFHMFPSDPARMQIWLDQMGRGDWKPTLHSRICSDHFVEAVIDRSSKGVELLKCAIPTRFRKTSRARKRKQREPPLVKMITQADEDLTDPVLLNQLHLPMSANTSSHKKKIERLEAHVKNLKCLFDLLQKEDWLCSGCKARLKASESCSSTEKNDLWTKFWYEEVHKK